MELPLARLLLVLSHHPDYMDISLGELKRLTKWVVIQQGINADQLAKLTSDFRHIEFFLDSVAKGITSACCIISRARSRLCEIHTRR